MTRMGRCCCGKTVIEVTGDPALNGVCHCNNCKQRTGSAFGISVYYRSDNFRIIHDSTVTFELSNEQGKQVRHFCKNCGSTVFWYVELFGDLVGVAGGCFAENPLPQPDFNAVEENQCPWVSFPDAMCKPLTTEDVENAR